MAGVRMTIKGVLDDSLPLDAYSVELFNEKVDAIFNHIVSSYGDEGTSVYGGEAVEPLPHWGRRGDPGEGRPRTRSPTPLSSS